MNLDNKRLLKGIVLMLGAMSVVPMLDVIAKILRRKLSCYANFLGSFCFSYVVVVASSLLAKVALVANAQAAFFSSIAQA